jgi:hypothetical protein
VLPKILLQVALVVVGADDAETEAGFESDRPGRSKAAPDPALLGRCDDHGLLTCPPAGPVLDRPVVVDWPAVGTVSGIDLARGVSLKRQIAQRPT